MYKRDRSRYGGPACHTYNLFIGLHARCSGNISHSHLMKKAEVNKEQDPKPTSKTARRRKPRPKKKHKAPPKRGEPGEQPESGIASNNGQNRKPDQSGRRRKKRPQGQRKGPHSGQKKVHHSRSKGKKPEKVNPDLVRVIPLGGVEEVGRNMIVIEIGEDIFVSDVGFEFTSDRSAPGVDYILPNTSYLEERKERIKGIFITHGHLDHIGGVPFIMDKIGNPPIFTRPLTAALLTKRQEDFPSKAKLKIRIVQPNDRMRVSQTHITVFPVTHSIPESTGLKFETPQGNIIISGDLKLDHVDGVPSDFEEKIWGSIAQENNLFFISDSTNAERPGFSITEQSVADNISGIIRRTTGRIVLGTFASQLARIIDVLKVCHETGRKVIIEGRSIGNNLEIAKEIGLTDVPEGLIIEASEIREYDQDRILILATGAQGEEFAALRRIALGNHRYIKLNRNDTVMLASSVIPGNERSVQELRDMLFHNEVSIITYRTSDIHSTGHGNIGELLWIFQKVAPKYFMPGYGFRSMTFSHAEAVADLGFPREQIIVGDNGTMVEFLDGKMSLGKDKANVSLTVVDGDYIGEMPENVLTERNAMNQSGIFMAVIRMATNTKKPKMLKQAEIRTRGAPLPKNPAKLMAGIQRIIVSVLEHGTFGKGPRKYEKIKQTLAKRLSEYLAKQTKKRPLIELVILEG